MHGPLSEIGLIEVLQLLERGKRSGTLRLVGPDTSAPRTIRIHHGRVVALGPDATDQAVTQSLVSRQLIAPAGDDNPEIAAEFREVVREELSRRALAMMLHWDNGRFDFDESPTTAGALNWSADDLVLALVADESSRAELADLLDDWHAIPNLFDVGTATSDSPVDLEALDWRILDAIDGSRDVAAIAALLNEALETVGQHIRQLEALAILHLKVSKPSAVQSASSSLDSGKYDDAVAQLRYRVISAPQDVEAWRTLGLAEIGAGRFEQAIEAFRAWQEADTTGGNDAAALIQAATTMMEALR